MNLLTFDEPLVEHDCYSRMFVTRGVKSRSVDIEIIHLVSPDGIAFLLLSGPLETNNGGIVELNRDIMNSTTPDKGQAVV